MVSGDRKTLQSVDVPVETEREKPSLEFNDYPLGLVCTHADYRASDLDRYGQPHPESAVRTLVAVAAQDKTRARQRTRRSICELGPASCCSPLSSPEQPSSCCRRRQARMRA